MPEDKVEVADIAWHKISDLELWVNKPSEGLRQPERGYVIGESTAQIEGERFLDQGSPLGDVTKCLRKMVHNMHWILLQVEQDSCKTVPCRAFRRG
jgi:hypothetical protein